MEKTNALLIVDVQNDFCPGGKLAVAEGDKVVAVLNDYIALFSGKGLPVFASRDWHPVRTRHFKEYGGKWPEHCVQRTPGARFHPDLRLPESAIVISKGADPEEDNYSVFQGKDAKGRSFSRVLKESAVGGLWVGGLATDYCVRHTVLDALAGGFKADLLIDAIRGVDPEDSERAIEEMARAGAARIVLERAVDSLRS